MPGWLCLLDAWPWNSTGAARQRYAKGAGARASIGTRQGGSVSRSTHLARLWKAPPRDLLATLEAATLLLFARALIRFVPFARWRRLVGPLGDRGHTADGERHLAIAQGVASCDSCRAIPADRAGMPAACAGNAVDAAPARGRYRAPPGRTAECGTWRWSAYRASCLANAGRPHDHGGGGARQLYCLSAGHIARRAAWLKP